MTVYRFTVTVEYTGALEIDGADDYEQEDLQDAAVDWALDGGYRDKTIVDVEVEPLLREVGEE